MRDAPSRVIIAELFKRGATVTAYDPGGHDGKSSHLRQRAPSCLRRTPDGGARQCRRALVIVTEWKEFRSPDFDVIKAEVEESGHFRRSQHFDPVLPRRPVSLPEHRPAPMTAGGADNGVSGASGGSPFRPGQYSPVRWRHSRISAGGRIE